jgi:hypothetical protein
LHEGSLVTVPADHLSGIRSLSSGIDRAVPMIGGVDDVRARMNVRMRMANAQTSVIGKGNE